MGFLPVLNAEKYHLSSVRNLSFGVLHSAILKLYKKLDVFRKT